MGAEAQAEAGESRLGLLMDEAAAAVRFAGQTLLSQAVPGAAQGGKQLYSRPYKNSDVLYGLRQ